MRDIRCTVTGNATADPSERVQPGGAISALLRIAVTGRYFDSDSGSFEDRKTEFISVFARRSLARNVLRSVSKGQPLIVTGRLSTSEWKDENGAPRFTLTMQAETVGHDLTFGTATFCRPLKADDVPYVDERTGENADPLPGDEIDVDTALTGGTALPGDPGPAEALVATS